MIQRKAAITIRRVTRRSADRLAELLAYAWMEDRPGNQQDGGAEAVDGFRRSLRNFDFLASRSFWIFAARQGAKFVGYVTVARIPKADGRFSFFYVDELYVAKAFRRQRVATMLLDTVHRLARRESAHAVRLLVHSNNRPARALYRRQGYVQSPTIYCQHFIKMK